MIDSEIILVDSNILVYAYDSHDKEKHEISKNILNKYWKKEIIYALSIQNLSELFVVTTKKISNPIPVKEMEENINDIINFSNFLILEIKPKTILKAIKLTSEYNLSYWDSLIASIMLENNINIIITEDEQDFKKVPGLKIINPFK
jgi:predicted nucleic acid-binding protein